MRARIGTAATLGSLLLLASACEATNLGAPPPEERFFFPSGVLLEPVARPTFDPADPSRTVLPTAGLTELPGARYLYVANGNNDRTYNSGTVVAIDLDAFWRSWFAPGSVDAVVQQRCTDAIAAATNPGDDAEALAEAAFTACAQRDAALFAGGLDPYCHEGDGAPARCVLPVGSAIEPPTDSDPIGKPCRRLPLAPHVVECDEEPFVSAAVRVGDFATTLAHSREDTDGDGTEETLRLWLPVRGDPSITYVDATFDDAGQVTLGCEQTEDDPVRPNRCSTLLDFLRNDEGLAPLDREPFNVAVWDRDPAGTMGLDPQSRGNRLAFVAHADGTQLSMVDLDGVRGAETPALVDFNDLYVSLAGAAGGFGLAIRPCFEGGQGPLGSADPEPNVPAITQGCSRPLVYTSFRFAGQLASFTASGLDEGEVFAEAYPPQERENCIVGMRPDCSVQTADDGTSQITCSASSSPACAYDPDDPSDDCLAVQAGPYCATPDQIGQPCAVTCEPQVRGSRRIQPSLLLDTSLAASPILGDMAFADARGDQLLILQTNPGALVSLDTSLADDGEPFDIPSTPPIEICAEPSRMKIYEDKGLDGQPVQRYALIACFRAALVYVVDLEALRVVEAVVVGTGPHDIAIDEAREAAYVINNLESSVSVIDLSRHRPTRFQELARLGLQDPFSR